MRVVVPCLTGRFGYCWPAARSGSSTQRERIFSCPRGRHYSALLDSGSRMAVPPAQQENDLSVSKRISAPTSGNAPVTPLSVP